MCTVHRYQYHNLIAELLGFDTQMCCLQLQPTHPVVLVLLRPRHPQPPLKAQPPLGCQSKKHPHRLLHLFQRLPNVSQTDDCGVTAQVLT